MFTSRRDIMGTLVNQRITTIAASLAALLIIALNLFLLYQVFFGGIACSITFLSLWMVQIGRGSNSRCRLTLHKNCVLLSLCFTSWSRMRRRKSTDDRHITQADEALAYLEDVAETRLPCPGQS